MKISVYIATGLDGFIAKANGDINWLASEATVCSKSNDAMIFDFE